MKNFRLLLKFIKGDRLLFLGALIAICLAALFATLIPSVIRVAIDSIIGNKPLELPVWMSNFIENTIGTNTLLHSIWIPCTIILLLTLGNAVFLFIKGKMSAVACENSGKRLREEMYNHILHLPYDFHVKSHAGDLIQRCTSDIETIQNFVSSQFVEIGQIIISFTFVFFIMFSIDPLYTFLSVALVPIILVVTVIFFNNMKKVFKATDEAEGRMTSTLQENLIGVRVVKAFGAQNFEISKFNEKNKEYKNYIYKIIELMSTFWSSTDFLCLTQFSAVLLMGVYWISTGRVTLGTLVAFISYSGMLIWPVRQLGQLLAFMGQAFVSLSRVHEILDTPVEEAVSNEKKPDIAGNIEFKDVYFEYSDGIPVLNNISFNIQKGQTVAILGATGSGKSSIVHLLIKLYDYQKGSIKINGVELKEIDRKWIRKNIGIVLQEPFLFSKTIRENIRFAKLDAHEKEIYAATSTAAIHDTILDFEKEYDTIVGERGVTLSGGQRQRLAIARAIIKDVPILLFDDSLSAVDMETDAAIRKSLKQRSRNVTTVIISHRITTLAEADVIFVLDGGIIKQSGTHEELISQEGLYKRIWNIQSSLEEELEDIV